MLYKGCGHKKVKIPNDLTPTGRTYKLEGSDLHIYVPSRCLGEVDRLRLIPKTHTSQNTRNYKRMTDVFFAYNSTTIIPVEWNCNLLVFSVEQLKDDAYSIIRALQSADSSGTHIDPEDHRATLPKKHMHQFSSGIRHLCSNDEGQ